MGTDLWKKQGLDMKDKKMVMKIISCWANDPSDLHECYTRCMTVQFGNPPPDAGSTPSNTSPDTGSKPDTGSADSEDDGFLPWYWWIILTVLLVLVVLCLGSSEAFLGCFKKKAKKAKKHQQSGKKNTHRTRTR